MVLKSKKRYHLAVEMLKWRSYKKLVGSENQENETKDEKGQPAKPGSALPAQQVLWRRKLPRGRLQLYTPENFPNPSAKGKEDPWKSAIADEDYFTGRKLLRIIGTMQFPIGTTGTVPCFLCQFKNETFRFIPRKAVKKQ